MISWYVLQHGVFEHRLGQRLFQPGALTLPIRAQQQRDKTCRCGLVRRAETAACITVKVLVEQHLVVKIWIVLFDRLVSKSWAASVLVA
jgi:hypothetical protein